VCQERPLLSIRARSRTVIRSDRRSLCRCRVRHGSNRRRRRRCNLSYSSWRQLIARTLRRCCFRIGESVGRTRIFHDRCRKRPVCGQSRVGYVARLKHSIKAEPEGAVHEHAETKVNDDARCGPLGLRIPRAHDPHLSPAQSSASHGVLPAGTLRRSLPRLELQPPPGQRRTSTGHRSELASRTPALGRDQAALPDATA
jgi:hypothetical protein